MADGQIVAESQFFLTDGAEVCATEFHAIKRAVADTRQRDLSEIHIFSDSRSALQTLNCLLVSRHRAISEIKDLVKRSKVEVHMHWITAHVGHIYNESADELKKAATSRPLVDVEVKPILRRPKDNFSALAGRIGGTTGNGEVTCDLFPCMHSA